MEHSSHTSESDHELEQEFDEEDEDVVISFLHLSINYYFRIYIFSMNSRNKFYPIPK